MQPVISVGFGPLLIQDDGCKPIEVVFAQPVADSLEENFRPALTVFMIALANCNHPGLSDLRRPRRRHRRHSTSSFLKTYVSPVMSLTSCTLPSPRSIFCISFPNLSFIIFQLAAVLPYSILYCVAPAGFDSSCEAGTKLLLSITAPLAENHVTR